MMKNKNLTAILIILFGTIIQFTFQYFEFSSTILIWEILIDLSLLSILILLIKYVYTEINLWQSILDLVKYRNYKKYFLFFNFPLIFIALNIVIGYIFAEIKIGENKNLATNILSFFLDIPAVIFFSLSTIMVEEFIFRFLLFKNSKVIYRILFSTTLFAIYKTVYDFNFEFQISNLLTLLNLFSVGYFSIVVFLKYKDLFLSYFFRVGLLVYLPFLINAIDDSDGTIFITKSNLFHQNGIAISLIILFFAIFMHFKLKKEIE